MTFRLRTKLTITFALLAAILIIVTGVFGRWMLEDNFKNYVINKQESNNNYVVNLISQQYSDSNSWNSNIIEDIGVRALEDGQIIKVIDTSGKTIWDATVHNNGMCQQMISHMANNMASKYPAFNGKYTVSNYPINSNSKNVGTVEIGYYGPFYFNDADLNFINTLNTALLWIALLALTLSLFLGTIFSKRISDPIGRVIKTAQMIEKGDYTRKSHERTTTKEINDLVNTINNLSTTLQDQDIQRKRLTADVAHELRTPLATLQGHIEAMIDGIWEPTVDRLSSCHSEIIRISKMVGDLQTLAKYDGETIVLDKTKINLKDLISNIIMNFGMQFSDKNVVISLVGEGKITADMDKLAQVFINLISNALKYTHQNGKVEVGIIEQETHVDISFKDNGKGISPDDLPYIFERFYRADKSRNRLTGGSGIGLAIVKAIVDAHNGRVQVNSKINEGTEFIITLPKI